MEFDEQYDESQSDTIVLSPASGKSLVFEEINVTTMSHVKLELDGEMVFESGPGGGSVTKTHGGVDQSLKITCGYDSHVSGTYEEE